MRDPRTPIEATLRGAQEPHDEGLFDELGLSNMSADDVAEYDEVGASSLRHLRHNLAAVADGPLPAIVLAAIEDAAQITRPARPPVSAALPQPPLTQPSTQGTQR